MPLGLVILAVSLSSFPTLQANTPVDYDREIAPLLRQYCAGCHNEDDFEGDFSLETFAAFQEGGSKGNPFKKNAEGHTYFMRTLDGSAKPLMPPSDEPQLTESEMDLLRRWIAEGHNGPKNDEGLFAHLEVPEVRSNSKGAQAITAATVTPDGKHLAVARYGRIEWLDAENLKVTKRFEELPGKVNAIHFSPDGKQMIAATGITGLNGVALLWDIATGKEIRRLEGHRDSLYDAEFSPDGKFIATAGYDKSIRFWDAKSGDFIRRIDIHNGAIFDLAFHPDSSVLASASADQTIKLWRVSDGVRLDTLNQPQGEQFAVTFTPDGRFVLGGGADNRIRMWRLISHKEPKINPVIHTRFAHEGAIIGLQLTPDGKQLVSTADNRSLKAWILPDLLETRAYDAQPDFVSSIVEGLVSERFTVARMDGSLRHYPYPPRASHRGTQNTGRSDSLKPLRTSQAKPAADLAEIEPNDRPDEATDAGKHPIKIKGKVDKPGDVDLVAFTAREGESWVFEIEGARAKSKIDSRLSVVDDRGQAVERIVLQAQRDSWFTFRGKDSNTSGDFRLHNWREMELNEYLYASGEVTRLWLYPRGPDSGFKVYPGFGNRHTYFGTSPITHALGAPSYIVRPFPAGSEPAPNGLPIFRLHYENDDDPERRFGKDSVVRFTAPRSGTYLIKVEDVRGFGSDEHHYTLNIRPQKPDFTVRVDDPDSKAEGLQGPMISPGSGKEFSVTANRLDGFQGAIHIEVKNLPKGYTVGGPVVIEAGQFKASGVILADASLPPAPKPKPAPKEGEKKGARAEAAAEAKAEGKPEAKKDTKAAPEPILPKPRLVANAVINGAKIERDLGTLGAIRVGQESPITLEIVPAESSKAKPAAPGKPLELIIRPGETITAVVKVDRKDFKDRIEFGTDDSGRNFAHGLYIDNIGLNGLMIVEGQTEREFFITAAPWVKPSSRTVHLRTKNAGGQASAPIVLHVVAGDEEGQVAGVE